MQSNNFFRGRGGRSGGKKKPAKRRVVLDDDDEEDSEFESVSVKKRTKDLVKYAFWTNNFLVYLN